VHVLLDGWPVVDLSDAHKLQPARFLGEKQQQQMKLLEAIQVVVQL
jgi:hypothetical protein